MTDKSYPPPCRNYLQPLYLSVTLYACAQRVNDLPNNVMSTSYLFADDTKLYRSIKEESDRTILQKDLDSLFDWSTQWLLKFHPEKCKVIRVRNKRKVVDDRSYTMKTYEESETSLEIVDGEKDIGVYVDSHLTFEKHMLTLINKANQLVGLIMRSFRYIWIMQHFHYYSKH